MASDIEHVYVVYDDSGVGYGTWFDDEDDAWAYARQAGLTEYTVSERAKYSLSEQLAKMVRPEGV